MCLGNCLCVCKCVGGWVAVSVRVCVFLGELFMCV